MAKDTLSQKPLVLPVAGVNDNVVIAEGVGFFHSNGVLMNNEQQLQRCNGKALVKKYDAPVLAIHGDLNGRVFVETTEAIYMIGDVLIPADEGIDPIDLPPPEEQ
jgi:hypothetical protein